MAGTSDPLLLSFYLHVSHSRLSGRQGKNLSDGGSVRVIRRLPGNHVAITVLRGSSTLAIITSRCFCSSISRIRRMQRQQQPAVIWSSIQIRCRRQSAINQSINQFRNSDRSLFDEANAIAFSLSRPSVGGWPAGWTAGRLAFRALSQM